MAGSCASTPKERWTRGAGAVVVGLTALGMNDTPLVAIPLGVMAVFLAIGAITGWCPTDLLAARRRSVGPRENAFGYAQPDLGSLLDPKS